MLAASVVASNAADDIQIDDSRFDWSGSYVGGVIGYGMAETMHCDPSFPMPNPGISQSNQQS